MAIKIKPKTLQYPTLHAPLAKEIATCTFMHVYVGEGMIRFICLDCNRNALKGLIQQMVKVGHYRNASWNVCFFNCDCNSD